MRTLHWSSENREKETPLPASRGHLSFFVHREKQRAAGFRRERAPSFSVQQNVTHSTVHAFAAFFSVIYFFGGPLRSPRNPLLRGGNLAPDRVHLNGWKQHPISEAIRWHTLPPLLHGWQNHPSTDHVDDSRFAQRRPLTTFAAR